MNISNQDGRYEVTLSKEETIVFFDWLARFNQVEDPNLFESETEERILWDLEAGIEKILPEVVANNYRERLEAARKSLQTDV